METEFQLCPFGKKRREGRGWEGEGEITAAVGIPLSRGRGLHPHRWRVGADPRPSVPLRHLVQPSHPFIRIWVLKVTGLFLGVGVGALVYSPLRSDPTATIEVRSRVVQGLSMPGHPENDQYGELQFPPPPPGLGLFTI